MTHKCFISFKTEDIAYKKFMQENLNIDMIDKSLNEPIDSDSEDYIIERIRKDYLADSTVTIHLIGQNSAESLGYESQKFIKGELRLSLHNGAENTRNGILGIVLPSMYDKIYIRNTICTGCGNTISVLNMGDDTTIREFHLNYHMNNRKCHWSEEDRYCVLVRWDDFIENPDQYIEAAFLKRNGPIADDVRVRV